MTYTQTLDRLATTTQDHVVAAFVAWQEDRLTREEFLAIANAHLVAAQSRGTALADVALAAYLTVATGRTVAPLGLVPTPMDHRPALAEAADDPLDALAKTAVAARAVALAAAQDAYGEAMVVREVPAWTRVLNAGACELCEDLAGDVLPGSAPMYHHKGCGCTQRPVLN